ncbi:hypothetical protein KSS87_005824 [Heliosperma pusillum]|nr:hypothetical protein KSS87_005824 [Heliosperma pusillum]
MSSSKESKDRYEKTFSRKKKDSTATTSTSTTSEKKAKTGEKSIENQDSQSQTKSNDKHTNITILGLQYKQQPPPQPSKKKKKKNNDSDGSLSIKLKHLKSKPGKDKEKKRKAEDKNVGVSVVKMRKKEKKSDDKDEVEGLECAFPTARITRIIKSDGFDCKITGEAVFLINKATEKFIELLSEDAYACAVEDRKSFVAYKHLSSVVSKGKLFDFLSDFVPEKVTAEKALAERNPTETQPS